MYRQIVDSQVVTNRAPLVVLFCHERYLMMSLTGNNQVMLLKLYYSTIRYADDLLNIGPFLFNLCFMFIFVMVFLSVPCSLLITCWERAEFWRSCLLCFVFVLSLSHNFLIFAFLSTYECILWRNPISIQVFDRWYLQMYSYFDSIFCK